MRRGGCSGSMCRLVSRASGRKRDNVIAMRIDMITMIVRDYDEAIAFYVGKLGFELEEDTDLGDGKRWVRVHPPGIGGAALLLAKAVGGIQLACVGNQTGGRVCAFIETDDFDRDYQRLLAAGVRFLNAPRNESYGRVAVFEDLCGNRMDLIQPIREDRVLHG